MPAYSNNKSHREGLFFEQFALITLTRQSPIMIGLEYAIVLPTYAAYEDQRSRPL